jgi:integrase
VLPASEAPRPSPLTKLADIPEEEIWLAKQKSKRIGLTRGYSVHSMRATFITTALENGATLVDVQRAAGHSQPSTPKLYHRRGYNPEKSASIFCGVLASIL